MIYAENEEKPINFLENLENSQKFIGKYVSILNGLSLNSGINSIIPLPYGK